MIVMIIAIRAPTVRTPTNIPKGIHSGAVIHHQDQSIVSVSCRIMNRMNSMNGPPVRLMLNLESFFMVLM